MHEPFTPTLEQVVKNTDAYLFVLRISLLLATPIVQVIQTLLVLRARVIFPFLRMQRGQHCAMMITSARSMDAIISPYCISYFVHNIGSNQTTFAQPRRTL